MKPREWPFRPHHITNDGDHWLETPARTKLAGVGIISNEYLQGIQTSICANLASPTSIIEFSLEGKPVRTDSRLLIHALRPACHWFREATGHLYCYESDSAHAELFYGLTRAELPEHLPERLKESTYIQDYASRPGVLSQVRMDKERPFLEYDCPLLGFRELLFPVFFEDRVIAVFFVGEITLEGRQDMVREVQIRFLTEHPDCFQEYWRESGTEPETVQKAILDEDAPRSEIPKLKLPEALGDAEYEALIEKACSELLGLERTLAGEMDLLRERFVRTCVEQRIGTFNRELRAVPRDNEDRLRLLWLNLAERLGGLVQDFALRYVVVFGPQRVPPRDGKWLDVVARAGDVPHVICQDPKSIRFNLDRVSSSARVAPATSVEDPTLFDGLQGFRGGLTDETNLIRLFPEPYLEQVSVAVLVGYSDKNLRTSVENQPGGYLDISSQSFYTVVLASLSSLVAQISQDNMESALRIFGHEMGQLTLGLDALRQVYLSEVGLLRTLAQDKAEDLCRDIDGLLRQLHFTSEIAKMVIEIRDPVKTEFLAFRELLFKWKDTYRLEAVKKDLQFDVQYPVRSDPERPEVWGDLELLEQLVFNLVNNAVKYCHRGTKIQMDCKKPDTRPGSPHVLTVTDYGPTIEESDRVYDLFYRGHGAAEAGLGIGLYIARKIADAHQGSISHKPTLVSPYNVPLIVPFLKSREGPDEFRRELLKEFQRLRSAGLYRSVVALDEGNIQRYAPTKTEMIRSIKAPTYEVTFRVVIPAKESA